MKTPITARQSHSTARYRKLRQLLALLTLLLPIASAQAEATLGDKVKAAYLYNFTKFVEWPAEALDAPGTPFPVCTVGDTPVTALLAPLNKRTVGEHPLTVRALGPDDDPAQCRILLLADDQAGRAGMLLEQLADKPVLTASSLPGFAARGGTVGFVTHEGRVRLEMNRAAALKAGVAISAKLFEVCLQVYDTIETAEAAP